tara:strand:- start:243 stop:482 length:240 start_codon:yes stop_codon:yes gene_type:complete
MDPSSKAYWKRREDEIKQEIEMKKGKEATPPEVEGQLYKEGSQVFGEDSMYQANMEQQRREQLAQAREQKKKGFWGRLF